MEKENIGELERMKKVKFRNQYYLIEFPTVGQFLEMEAMKQAYTDNRYGIMASSGVKSMYHALDLVDSIVFISVMVPKIKKEVTINIGTITLEESKELINFYKSEIADWYVKMLEKIYSFSNEDTEIANEDSNK